MRVLGVVVIVMGLAFLGLHPVPAERAPRAPRAARRPVGCTAARHHVRARLGAVHRPDARRDHRALARRRDRGPRRPARGRVLPGASGCRSCSSRSASSAARRRWRSCAGTGWRSCGSAAGCSSCSASRWSRASGASGRPGCRVSCPATTRSCRWCDMSQYRPEGISDVFTEPTEASGEPQAGRPGHRPVRLAALGVAAAHEHARRAPAAHAARGRRGARHGLAAARAAPRARRHLPHRPPDARAGPRPARRLQRLLVGLVLGDLPAAVRLAGRLHPAAHQGAPRGRARPPAARARDGSAGSRRRATACPTRPRSSSRGRRPPCCARLAAAAVRAHLPRRGARRGRRHVVGRRRARLPARDRQPGLPPGPRRPARSRSPPARCCTTAARRSWCRARASPTRRAPTTRSSRAPRSRRRAWSRSRCSSTTSSPGSTRRRWRRATSPRT